MYSTLPYVNDLWSLQSAGSQKEDKKKKGKKGKDVQQLKGGKPSGPRPQSGKGQRGQPMDIHKITMQTGELLIEGGTYFHLNII